MTDDELEGVLAQWRPAGPPPALRARVMTAAAPARVWPLALAAAALAGLALFLPRATDALADQVPGAPLLLSREAVVLVLTGAGLDPTAVERLAEAALTDAARRAVDEGARPSRLPTFTPAAEEDPR